MQASRNRSPLSIVWLGLALALTLGASGVACGGPDRNTSCATGAERCACYGNGTCNAGLQCLSNLCVAPTGAGGATGASGSTGAAGIMGASGSTGSGATMGSGGSGGALSSAGTNGTAGSGDAGGGGGTAGTGSGGSAAGSGGRGGTIGNAGTNGNAGAGGRGGTTGNAGSSGNSGSGGPGGAGNTGSAGAGGTGSCGDLIDDMEAGTGFICQGDGRVGYWYTYIDSLGGSSITPPVSESPAKSVGFSPPLGSSTRAMHASGAFSSYAGIGFLINAPLIGAPWSTYDASGRTGIEFWAKGTGYLRVLMHTPATVATQYHGTCATSVCMGAVSRNYLLSPNVWVGIDLPFASLTPGTAPFDPALLSAIEFQPNSAGVFDLWIDDVRFY